MVSLDDSLEKLFGMYNRLKSAQISPSLVAYSIPTAAVIAAASSSSSSCVYLAMAFFMTPNMAYLTFNTEWRPQQQLQQQLTHAWSMSDRQTNKQTCARLTTYTCTWLRRWQNRQNMSGWLGGGRFRDIYVLYCYYMYVDWRRVSDMAQSFYLSTKVDIYFT